MTNEMENREPEVQAENTKLRDVSRRIAAAVVISRDNKFLFGKKDPSRGGVYPNAWHLPGGGVEDGESLADALRRELSQETTGLDISQSELKQLPFVGHGSSVRTLRNGERVLAHMEFNRFEIHLEQTAEELKDTIKPGDDLVELRWVSKDELADLEQIPGGIEFFRQAGYIN